MVGRIEWRPARERVLRESGAEVGFVGKVELFTIAPSDPSSEDSTFHAYTRWPISLGGIEPLPNREAAVQRCEAALAMFVASIGAEFKAVPGD